MTAQDAAQSTATGCTVVFVDSFPLRRESYREALSALGYRTIAADSLDTAVAAAIGERPDIVVTDASVDGGTGYTLLARLRADPRTRHLPVIALAAGPLRREEGARPGGFTRILLKPVTPAALAREIRDVAAARSAA
jgi:CheY-like chemotaxis protein